MIPEESQNPFDARQRRSCLGGVPLAFRLRRTDEGPKRGCEGAKALHAHAVRDELAVELGEVPRRKRLGRQDLVDSFEQLVGLLLCQKKEATYCVDKNPDVHPDLTERLALVIAVHVEIVEQIVREMLVGLGGRFGGLTDLAASGEARALCVRYDVVYEYEIIDIAGSIDRLALRGMLEDGVGKDRQRAVACPMPESAAGETEAISIQHDAHVGLVAATVARLRCAAVHTRLERNVRFSILGGLETRDFDERPAAPAQRYRVICRGQVYDPEETVWSEHQG